MTPFVRYFFVTRARFSASVIGVLPKPYPLETLEGLLKEALENLNVVS